MKNAISLLALAYFACSLFAQSSSSFTYLALGDSVPFGMNVTLLEPYATGRPIGANTYLPPANSSEFVGYPETLAAIQHVSEMNASCPGETSGSFLGINLVDNGCNSPHLIPPAVQGASLPTIAIEPFKPNGALHTNYSVPQLQFALTQLTGNKGINLVTLSIGANDILLALPAAEAACAPALADSCMAAQLAPTLQMYGQNLAQILGAVRGSYSGTFVLVTYYSPLPALNSVTQALNSVMTEVAANFSDITIADGYTAFQVVSVFADGNACKAGLLIPLPQSGTASEYNQSPCDIHPSPLGRDILAAAVELKLLAHH